VVKTLQSIKKGIALLDERRATLDVDGLGHEEQEPVDDGWEEAAGEPSQAAR
jgi:hypothetical protein